MPSCYVTGHSLVSLSWLQILESLAVLYRINSPKSNKTDQLSCTSLYKQLGVFYLTVRVSLWGPLQEIFLALL